MATVFDKLNLKTQREILVLNAPESFENEFKKLADVRVVRRVDEAKQYEFTITFVTRRSELEKLAKKIIPRLAQDAVLWFAYPKRTSKRFTCDFNRDTGWDELVTSGFDSVRQVAIDEDWSALRFRRIEFIKR